MTWSVLIKADPVWGEALNSLVMTVVGAFLLLPIHSFALPIYNGLQAVMSEELWGVLFLIIGLINLSCVLVADVKFRKITALMMTFLWTLMFVSFVTSSIAVSFNIGLLCPLILCLAINSFAAFFQIGRRKWLA